MDRIAVLGAGAVGCYFGGMLARAGVPVTLIGRQPHVDTINRDGLYLESTKFQEHIRVTASTDASAARGADVVLFCVKTLDTASAAGELAPHVDSGAIVLSLQNGVDNVERIRESAGIEALPAVVYVAAEMPAPGRLKHNGRGDLIIGETHAPRLTGLFAKAGVPCKVSSNVQGDLWAKLVMNCSHNAVSALARSRYGRMAADPEVSEVSRMAVEEVLAVARASGIQMPDVDYPAESKRLATVMSNALSSTAQDITHGKRTEIDSLNGYIARRGKELGIPTPVNQTLHALVKLLEES